MQASVGEPIGEAGINAML